MRFKVSILPSTAVIELTSRCNHKCFFCSCPWEYDKDYLNSELSTKEWFAVIDKYMENGISHITFTGGEPLMRDDLFDIISYASQRGLSLGLISNGRKINEDFLVKLSEYNVLLSISVPGIKTYAEHTGVDNIDHILSLFTKCKEINIKTVANITVTKKNIGELYENIALPILYGASYILLNRFLPGGRGMSNKDYLLTNEDVNDMLDVAEEVLNLSGINGHVGTELPLCIIRDPKKYKMLKVSNKCAAVKSFFVTDPTGYIKVCNHSPERLCKWDDIVSLKHNATWNRYLLSDYMPRMCCKCKDKDKCDGGCRESARVNFGRIDENDPCFFS